MTKMNAAGCGKEPAAGLSLLVFADLHYVSDEDCMLIDNLPPCDIVLMLGDISRQTSERICRSADKNRIRVLYVLGNHDDRGQLDSIPNAVNVDGRVMDVCCMRFGGAAGGPRYKRGTQVMRTQEEMDALLDTLPPCGILLTHDGPYHLFRDDVPHEGFRGIDRYLKKKQPSLLLYGHQHVFDIREIYGTKTACIYRCAMVRTEPFSVTKLL